MTTLQELGEILVGNDDRAIQRRAVVTGEGADWHTYSDVQFNLNNYEYRLMPKVTYYRVFKDSLGLVQVDLQNFPFQPWRFNETADAHIHDFEIEK